MISIVFVYILLLALFAANYGWFGVGIFNLLWLTFLLLRKKPAKKE